MLATANKQYSMDDLNPILKGEERIPNFEPMDCGRMMNNIAACGHSMHPQWGWANFSGRKEWAQFFLTPTAMGSAPRNLDGAGYVIAYGPRDTPTTGTFAICRHEKVAAPGANHSRGWHPGHCKKCGLDMTVDSSD